MRATLKRGSIVLLLLAGLISSCGKTGSSKSSNSLSTETDIPNLGQVSSEGLTTLSKSQLLAKFSNKAFSANSPNGLKLYILTPTYSSGGNYQVSYCINLIFKSYGNCGNNSYNYWGDYLNDLAKYGDFYEVYSSTQDAVYYKEIRTFTQYGNPDYYVYRQISRTGITYKTMLAIDKNETDVKITQARLRDSQGRNIEAYVVEVFQSGSSEKLASYVVSPELPMIANPVAELDENGQFVSMVSNIGNVQLTSLMIPQHIRRTDFWQGSSQFQQIQSVTYGYNNYY